MTKTLSAFDELRNRQEMALFLRTSVPLPKKAKGNNKPGIDAEIEELVSSIRLNLKSCCSLLSEMENENESITEALPELTDCLHTELTATQRHVSSLLFKLKNQGAVTPSETQVTEPKSGQSGIPTSIPSERTNNAIKDYEVFQGETNDTEGNETKMRRIDLDDEDDNPRIGLSISLHDELKDAILKKADEHQEREAKALGIPVEEVTPHFFHESKSETSKTEEVNGDGTSQRSFTKRTVETTQRSFTVQSFQAFKVTDVMNGVPGFDTTSFGHSLHNQAMHSSNSSNITSFPSLLAAVAVERSKDMKVNQSEECFEDDDEAVEAQEQSDNN